MKKKIIKKMLLLSLSIVVALAFMPMTAFAGGGPKANPTPLTMGTSSSFTISDDQEDNWFKFKVSAASKVTMAIDLKNTTDGDFIGVFLFDDDADTSVNGHFNNTADGIQIDESLGDMEVSHDNPSRTATYYLNAYKADKYYYINVKAYYLDNGGDVTITLKSDKIPDTGALLKSSATTVIPALYPSKKTVQQSSLYMKNPDLAQYWYQFTLNTPSKITVTYSLARTKHFDSNKGSNFLFLKDKGGKIIDGKIGNRVSGEINLTEHTPPYTQSITYTLPRGTYYTHLNLANSDHGVLHSLAFTQQKQLAKPTGLKLTAKKASWKNVANNSGYTLKIYKGSKVVKTVPIAKGKTSYKIPKKLTKKAGKYKFTIVAKGKGSYYNSQAATSKVFKKK